MVKSRISEHKQKVSESAIKLASLLDIEEIKNTKSEEDYHKINSQMEVLSTEKKEFMSKINSFAEKLKIL